MEVCYNNFSIDGKWILLQVLATDRSQWPRGLRRTPWWIGHWDREFESRKWHECLSLSFCVVLSCVGRGLSSGWSAIQVALPIVELIHNFWGNSELDQVARPNPYRFWHQSWLRTMMTDQSKTLLFYWMLHMWAGFNDTDLLPLSSAKSDTRT
jgi:hypothetical protein